MLINVPQHNGNEDENARFTTDEADAWLRGQAGVDAWDLDVAACDESHRAPRWYGDKGSHFLNGLENPWEGRVFCNPPWDDIEPWVERAFRLIGPQHPQLTVIGFLLPGNRTHRPWWQKWVEPFRDNHRTVGGFSLGVAFAPKRFAYGAPGNPRALGVGEPNFTTVALIWRPE